MTGAYFAAGPCAFCGVVFTFNPERVPSVPSNAPGVTHRNGAKHPICAECLATINYQRMLHGIEPMPPPTGAYGARRGTSKYCGGTFWQGDLTTRKRPR